MKTITALVVRAIEFCAQYAWPVIAAAMLLTVASSWYAATHFAMTTDINQLISPNIPWREREAAFEKAFPQFEIDRRGDRCADAGAGRRSDRARWCSGCRSRRICSARSSSRKAALSSAERLSVRAARSARPADENADAGATPGAGAGRRSDPARRHSSAAIRPARRAGRPDHARQHDLADDARRRHDREGECRPAGELFLARTGRGPTPSTADELLRFLNIQAALDYSELEPGQKATDAIRQAAADLDFASQISGAPAPDRPGADGGRGIRARSRRMPRSTPP